MKQAIRSALLAAVAATALTACASTGTATTGGADLSALPQSGDAYFTAAHGRIAQLAPAQHRALNVILFIGDGMGIATVTATRIFAGQRAGLDGESYQLTMDTFPHTALSRTYGHDAQISDSAPTATALTSGVKTGNGIIGLTAEATPEVCAGSMQHATRSIFEIAEEQGMATGVVSTARITHATPAATYAHTANRDWENDAYAASHGGADCIDIARQLIEWPVGDGFEIALGGGRANFLPSSAADPEYASRHGERADGRDLAAEWAGQPGHVYVWNSAQLAAAPADARVLGLFSPSHMAYENDRAADPGGEPSLSEMTAAAIRRLAREDGGYVLMIEGGRIDHAHHAGQAGQALSEAAEFDQAIRTALELTSREDTLIIVTADHSHTLTISGYAPRNNPILGLSGERGEDGRPYTTLGYANGPGAVFPAAEDDEPPQAVQRPDLTGVDTQSPSYRAQALVPLDSETHGGEDVPIYGWGPGDDAVAGTLEENTVFHIMARSLGWR